MSEDFVEIVLPSTRKEEYIRMLEAAVTDTSSDQPLPDAKVLFRIEGDGTFQATGESITELEIVSDRNGKAWVEWFEYPRYSPPRRLKSVIRASCVVPNSQVRLETRISGTANKMQLLEE